MKKTLHIIFRAAGGIALAYLLLLLFLPKIALNQQSALILLIAAIICGAAAGILVRRKKDLLIRPVRLSASLLQQIGFVALLLLGHQVVQPEIYEKIRLIDHEVRAKAGAVAPEIKFLNIESGKRDALSNLKGHVVLVNFWATWCGPCVKEMPDLSSVQQRYREKGFVLLTLSVEELPKIQRFFAKTPVEGIHGKLKDAASVPDFYGYGKVLPTSFLIDKEGVIKAAFPSVIPIDVLVPQLEKML